MSESQIIERNEDMSPMGRLALILQSDGDVIVAVRADPEELHQTSVEFCQPFSGGGRSPATLKALKVLAEAMTKDNADNPIFTDTRRQFPPFDANRYRSVKEMRAEIDRLRVESCRFYRANGSFEQLDSPEEVVQRRIEAAKEIERLRTINAKLVAACEGLIPYAEGVYPSVGLGHAVDNARSVLSEVTNDSVIPPSAVQSRDERVSDLERRVSALLDEWYASSDPSTITVRWRKGGAQGDPWDPGMTGQHVMIPAQDSDDEFGLYNWFAGPLGWENITWWIPVEELKPPEITPTS